MIWPIWFVLGLAILSALITVIYAVYLERIAGYKWAMIRGSDTIRLAEIYIDNRKVGEILARKESDPMLETKLEERLAASLANSSIDLTRHHIIPINVMKEPGYNAFLSYHKNRNMFMHAAKEWRQSAFHAMMMPIEIVLRVSLFPIWTMIDLLAHERKLVACAVMDPDLSDSDLREIGEGFSIIEAYAGLYIRFKGDGRVSYAVADLD